VLVDRQGHYSVGASGAISGVIAAAFIVGWRLQGWRGPLTQAMLRWLGFVIVFGLLSNMSGSNIDNAAHMGGALAGGVIALLWRRGYRYTPAATKAILSVCTAILVACVGLVGWHVRTDPFATMPLQDRVEYTRDALGTGNCRGAHDGLLAVERLRGAVTSLRKRVEEECGHVIGR
jgi:rhomboid protease GluP